MLVRVIDGDTVEDPVTGTVYRLAGADACEKDQRATLDGQEWPCGAVATAWLVTATLGKPVSCSAAATDRYRRILATCSSPDHADLAADMIRAGAAVAYRYRGQPTNRHYAEIEHQAQAQQVGIWSRQCGRIGCR